MSAGQTIEGQLSWDGEPMYCQETAAELKLRQHTVFRPCKRHAPRLATETRYRRAEVFVEGGYASSPCEGGICEMSPGRDFYTAEFVAEHPVYRIGDES